MYLEPIGHSFYNVDKEIRTKGTSHYQFSLDPEERKRQQEELNALREQTMNARAAAERIKKQRREKLSLRLEKVRQRRKELENLEKDGEDYGDDESDDDSD